MKLSVCVIIKNEEKRLETFLSNMRLLVDEIVVVDTGSTDHSVKIARKYADTIVEEHVFESFSKARNISLNHATGDWALILDADEIILKDAVERIYKTIAESAYVAYRLPRYNYLGDGHWSTSSIVKLIKLREGLQFSRKVHESVRDSLAGRETPFLDAYIHHFPDPRIKKNTLYTSWLEEYLRENPRDVQAQTHLVREYFVAGDYDRSFTLAQEVIENGNDNDRIYTFLGYMYIYLGKLDDAESSFFKIDNIDTSYSNALTGSVAAGLSIIHYKRKE